VRFLTDKDIEQVCREVGLTPQRSYSFPFPRAAGKYFAYNEFCVRATLEAAPS